MTIVPKTIFSIACDKPGCPVITRSLNLDDPAAGHGTRDAALTYWRTFGGMTNYIDPEDRIVRDFCKDHWPSTD